jgi:hypothetical protein
MVMTSIMNGEVDGNFLIIKLDFKIVSILNCVRDLDANLGWCLIPGVCNFGSDELFLSNVFFSQDDNVSSRNSL